MWAGIQNGDQLIISSFGIMIFIAFLSSNLLMKKTLREKKIDTKIGDDMKKFGVYLFFIFFYRYHG